MNWLNKNYKAIVVSLLAVISIPILVMFSFWFWDRYLPILDKDNATLFNNLVTPFATLASVLLFVWLAVRQQKLAESQSVTPHYERELERIQKILNRKNAPDNKSEGDLINYLPGHIYSVNQNAQFKGDYKNWLNGNIPDLNYYVNTPWFKVQLGIFQVEVSGVESLEEALKLIQEIDSKDCKLNPESKRFIKGRLRNEIFGEYIQGIHFIGDYYKIFVIQEAKSKFVSILETRYGSYYPKLVQGLES